MIPPELENLKMWIRRWNHTLLKLDNHSKIKKDHHTEMFYGGSRFILKELSRQYAYDVKAWRMLHESKKIL